MSLDCSEKVNWEICKGKLCIYTTKYKEMQCDS